MSDGYSSLVSEDITLRILECLTDTLHLILRILKCLMGTLHLTLRILECLMDTLHLTLRMTAAEAVETSVITTVFPKTTLT